MGFAAKIKDFFGFTGPLPEGFFDDLEDLLVEGDLGPGLAVKLVGRLQELSKKEKITEPGPLRERFAKLLEDGLKVLDPDTLLKGESPALILLLGVNGTGKTTTAAKLAARYRARGRNPILAAADTFRAGAVDQLKIHGQRLKIRVVAHRQGGDPAAVVYDAMEAALAGGGDLVIADTAGRMHTRTALVEELKKIDRVLETRLKKPETAARCIKWLVLDATTGRNALAQAEIFHGAVPLDGVILTKYDSGARGGVVFSLSEELKLPTVFICDGEGYEHIRPFDPAAFAERFAGRN
ncbi:MAG: signal recognition particle-docking protein FtsY [Spirochaetaceae bacterium]|jgi:fused signal recognition particle receptor|nr:signal recognition particle-docking protein FtsY [Spirochaetaceae bacterium]